MLLLSYLWRKSFFFLFCFSFRCHSPHLFVRTLFFCYCVNGKWVFASRIKVYSVSIYFIHAAACLTRKMFCFAFYISLLSKEWTLGKNNNKNNSKATLVMTSNRKIRETNRADDFWCCRVFFVYATAVVPHPLVVLKTFFLLILNITWRQFYNDTKLQLMGQQKKNPFECHRVN